MQRHPPKAVQCAQNAMGCAGEKMLQDMMTKTLHESQPTPHQKCNITNNNTQPPLPHTQKAK